MRTRLLLPVISVREKQLPSKYSVVHSAVLKVGMSGQAFAISTRYAFVPHTRLHVDNIARHRDHSAKTTFRTLRLYVPIYLRTVR